MSILGYYKTGGDKLPDIALEDVRCHYGEIPGKPKVEQYILHQFDATVSFTDIGNGETRVSVDGNFLDTTRVRSVVSAELEDRFLHQ